MSLFFGEVVEKYIGDQTMCSATLQRKRELQELSLTIDEEGEARNGISNFAFNGETSL